MRVGAAHTRTHSDQESLDIEPEKTNVEGNDTGPDGPLSPSTHSSWIFRDTFTEFLSDLVLGLILGLRFLGLNFNSYFEALFFGS
ncbi:hypothetical protein KQX54_010978 [Cotesia glomerata]|uniref:Uncharacterized protein n=1 Tax=Cotesia glomerata TaxID=32391 RepID=A0AAV7IP88_COTGL|nr:hypothetical protein KQX54_010978 [Cotesia glomerata]